MLDLFPKYEIKKPVRLIELFAGYGSQALALKRIGVEFEHHQVVEFDKYAIKTYNALHNTNFETKDITKLKSLNVSETNKYDYIMTYSFPCTDLSLAGQRRGMEKGSGTSSGLLWEVERLLLELNDLPQILVMENVTAIHSVKFNNQFRLWMEFLTRLGYSNQWRDLNAKDYGIPQSRDRTFLVSILGDYQYEFPKPQELKIKLKDLLQENVDEKYFLSDKLIKTLSKVTDTYDRSKQFKPHEEPYDSVAHTVTTRAGGRPPDNFIKMPEATIKGYSEAYEGDGVYINRPHQKRGVVQSGMTPKLKAHNSDIGVIVAGQLQPKDRDYNKKGKKREEQFEPRKDELSNAVLTNDIKNMVTNGLTIRKLTPREVFRLMGLYDEDIDKIIHVNSNAQLYKQAGNSIVVQVLEGIFKELFR